MQTYYFDAGTGLQRRMDSPPPDVNSRPLAEDFGAHVLDFLG